ncbi:hypothetical protein VCRA2123O444_100029 [Vibrio crassostreae]|nr:hypothetical protein VCRA2119O431_100029 [Vibrio crassostreae]CAK1705471.1 hypothetical protein VCRA2114O422_100127 [Vibrio crassostreae]CAK1723579.1 hypothetical protein VCRA2119O430_110128 [Vibrio crassostreae]CAK1724163.1 hypothetical protein VCRA2113O409_110127 [Vibrio crassostreae]CAK1729886.1 hypothetical protein VCRA2117O428_120029 [Vibrio crassostreae]
MVWVQLEPTQMEAYGLSMAVLGGDWDVGCCVRNSCESSG